MVEHNGNTFIEFSDTEAAHSFPSMAPFTPDAPCCYIGAWSEVVHGHRRPRVSVTLWDDRVRVVWHVRPPSAAEVENWYAHLSSEVHARVAAIRTSPVALLIAEWERSNSAVRGIREVWDFTINASDDARLFLGSFDLPSGNRVDGFLGTCQCQEGACTNRAVNLTWATVPTGADSYAAQRRVAPKVLTRLEDALQRRLTRPRIEPRHDDPRLLVFDWKEAAR